MCSPLNIATPSLGDEELLAMVRFPDKFEQLSEIDGTTIYRSRTYKTYLPYNLQDYVQLLRRAYEATVLTDRTTALVDGPANASGLSEITYAVTYVKNGLRRMRLFQSSAKEIGEGSYSNVYEGKKISSGQKTAVKKLKKVGRKDDPGENINKLYDAIEKNKETLRLVLPQAFERIFKGGKALYKVAVLMDRPLFCTKGEMHLRHYEKIDFSKLSLLEKLQTARDIILAMELIKLAGFLNLDLKYDSVMESQTRAVIVDYDDIVEQTSKPQFHTVRTSIFTDWHADYTRVRLQACVDTLKSVKQLKGMLSEIKFIDPKLAEAIERNITDLYEDGLLDEGQMVENAIALLEDSIRQCLVKMHYFCLATTLANLFVPTLQRLDDEALLKYEVKKELPHMYLKRCGIDPMKTGSRCLVGLDWQKIHDNYIAYESDFLKLPVEVREGLTNLFVSEMPLEGQMKGLLDTIQSQLALHTTTVPNNLEDLAGISEELNILLQFSMD